ncbi:MAG: aspartate aminotransferase [Halanaerobium sp. 4-GBenrich]|jgi:aspartate aminotransferase|uniref:Aminotransferase n=2 Tax=Halanaerobium congolense TaxID=54121 RepID=A0A1G6I2W3_9FIRM|nr:MAG: aspartate aminotransferase [Halanaerobium sp. T82-1]ODS50374.1 MAG: aspartate aminotransferase [Halanaerobium sp. 4-GBenrich]TDS33618.1 aspartate aminotransferase [Halanaerobium congolense]TDX45358.1 aspartate aminotransferase [Halanaerobium congolense]SDC00076.1 aspartate aminotransferase [Halanaerobium congolense]
MMDYSARIAKIEESKTLAVSKKADKLTADGEDIVSFGAGEPDFPTPEFIKKAAVEAMDKGYTGYTSVSGLPELKESAVNYFADNYSYEYSTDEVIVCNGGKQVLFNALSAIVEPEDEILIPKPYWVSYPEIVKLAGGKPRFIETKVENKYKLTAAELKAAITAQTKAVIINSPSNPDGHFYSKSELRQLIEIIAAEDIFIISDEIYDKLLYDGRDFSSMIELFPELKEKILVVNGMSKSYSMTGWRVGLGFASSEWIAKMTKIQSHTTSNVNTIAQYASAKALASPELKKIVKDRCQIYQERRDLTAKLLADIAGLKTITPAGAFYFFIDISELISKKIEGQEIEDSLSFTDLLLEYNKVAVVPGIAFGMDNFIRISFALSKEKIREGISRIADFAARLEA